MLFTITVIRIIQIRINRSPRAMLIIVRYFAFLVCLSTRESSRSQSTAWLAYKGGNKHKTDETPYRDIVLHRIIERVNQCSWNEHIVFYKIFDIVANSLLFFSSNQFCFCSSFFQLVSFKHSSMQSRGGS